jgi:hypothetical protein
MKPVGHIAVPYPALEEGLHSVQHLGRAAIGAEALSRNTMVAHAWVATGAGLAQLFPPDGPMMSMDLSEDEKSALAEYAAMKAGGVEFNPERWKKILAVLIPLILKLLV